MAANRTNSLQNMVLMWRLHDYTLHQAPQPSMQAMHAASVKMIQGAVRHSYLEPWFQQLSTIQGLICIVSDVGVPTGSVRIHGLSRVRISGVRANAFPLPFRGIQDLSWINKGSASQVSAFRGSTAILWSCRFIRADK